MDVNLHNLADFLALCRCNLEIRDHIFRISEKIRSKWAYEAVNRFGTIGKIAYIHENPVGFIQFIPDIKERALLITCILIPNPEDRGLGIGRRMVETLICDAAKPKDFFGGKGARTLITYPPPVETSLEEFFEKMGFRHISPFSSILYYPIERYMPQLKRRIYKPSSEEKNDIIVFYDPSCPVATYLSLRVGVLLKEITKGMRIPIKMVNMLEKGDLYTIFPLCLVKGKPIDITLEDEEAFRREVIRRLGTESCETVNIC